MFRHACSCKSVSKGPEVKPVECPIGHTDLTSMRGCLAAGAQSLLPRTLLDVERCNTHTLSLSMGRP